MIITIFLFLSTLVSSTKARGLQGNSGGGGGGNIVGIDDKEGYEKVANAFVGLNPKLGDGSGFIIGDITAADFPIENPVSGGPRVDLCTCDCVAGDDGVGCVGWGGVAFRYSSLFWKDPKGSNTYEGQIQAYQLAGGPTNELNFIGNVFSPSPGGKVVYNVACTDSLCDGRFSGAFRQSNDAVSCEKGLEDQESNGPCSERCENAAKYQAWIAYCKADDEDTESGFSGYGN